MALADSILEVVQQRKAQGISVDELAEKLGWTTLQLKWFETGVARYSTVEQYEAYVAALGLELRIIFVPKEDTAADV